MTRGTNVRSKWSPLAPKVCGRMKMISDGEVVCGGGARLVGGLGARSCRPDDGRSCPELPP